MKLRIILVSLVIFLFVGGAWFAFNGNTYALGIKVLSNVKFMSESDWTYEALLTGKKDAPSYEDWNKMLGQYVMENGDVNYKGWQKDTLRLDSYLEKISANPPSKSWSYNTQMAYWINAYNAFTIQIVLKHYPIESIKDIGGAYVFVNSVWDLKFFQIGGKEMDLNTIEHRILRKEFPDSRVHFAINCASFSCPRLRNEAYTAEKLEEQLQDQAFYFTNNPRKNRIIASEAEISQIFQWYQDDFERTMPLKAYVNQYAKVKIQAQTSIEYLPYNWNLNETPKATK